MLSESNRVISYNTWYTLRVEVAGDRVRGYVNDELAVGFTGLTSHPQGKVGVRVRNSQASYDDALVETW